MKASSSNARPAGRLSRHLTWIIAAKVVALTLIWWLFFRPELRPPADSTAVAQQLLQTGNVQR